MSDFEERFQKIIDTVASGNRSKFSSMTGKKTSYASDVVKGRAKPGFEYMKMLSDEFKISLDWLILGQGEMVPDEYSNQSDFVYVPRYDIQASAGHGALVHSEQIVDHLAFRKDWVCGELKTSPKELVLISASGDSMEPTIEDKDLLLVNLTQNTLSKEGIFVIRIDEILLAKRLQKHIDGSVHIISDNRNYETYRLLPENLKDLSILGRVVWFGRVVSDS